MGIELQARCGGVRHLILPNKHCLEHITEWSSAYPNAKVYAPPDVEELPCIMDFLLTDDAKLDYVSYVEQVLFRGNHTTEAVVFFHKPSGTLLVADLIHPKAVEAQSWWSLIGPPPAPLTGTSSTDATASTSSTEYLYCTPSFMRWSFRWHNEPEWIRRPVDTILKQWQPTQMILLARHSEVITEYATNVLEQVWSWVPQVEEYPEHIPFDRKLLEPFQRGTNTTTGGEHEVKARAAEESSNDASESSSTEKIK